MAFRRYSKQEPLVFVYIMLPYIATINLIIFGSCVFSSAPAFLSTFLISSVYFFTVYAVFGSVAMLIKNRYPAAGDLFKRIRIMLPVFYVMNIAAIHGVYLMYGLFALSLCAAKPEMLWWTVIYGCIMSTLITFINEGMANWEKWKNSLAESEKLRNAYERSKLLGLKGQINPHFLFNCFNTLSGLIHEDPDRAEKFLDEMTRVHRYLLRRDDEYLVSLEDEMKFATAYLNLARARFGDAIRVHIEIPRTLSGMQIPPLSMQVVLEHIIYTNALHKNDPLQIRVIGRESGELVIAHSRHDKTIVQDLNLDEGLDNLVTRYRLLDAREVRITETDTSREIVLPLFHMQSKAA